MTFMDIVEIVQKNLGYPPVKKIDPNTSEPVDKEEKYEAGSLAQAAIPVTLIGILNYMELKLKTVNELSDRHPAQVQTLFEKNYDEIIAHVARYSGTTEFQVTQEMNFILKEAMRVILEIKKTTSLSAHEFVVASRAASVLYLPASLHLGTLLGDNHIDDNTTKMEGPISSVMHSLENKFK